MCKAMQQIDPCCTRDSAQSVNRSVTVSQSEVSQSEVGQSEVSQSEFSQSVSLKSVSLKSVSQLV